MKTLARISTGALLFMTLPLRPALADETAAAVPAAAYSVGAAFDDDRGVLVVFGGFRPGLGPVGETWEWNGAWRRVAVSGPSPRNSPALAYDPVRRRVVLFGGDSRSAAFSDTWEWDGITWTPMNGAGPPGRSLHRMVFVPRRGRVMLFGGTSSGSGMPDPWEWDGQAWSPIDDSGPIRVLHGLAVDPASGMPVVFGGSSPPMPSGPGVTSDETWVLGPAGWRSSGPRGPSTRDHVAMVADPGRKRIVLYGGASNDSTFSDTWERVGAAWKRMDTAESPGPRANPVMVYDSRLGRVLLYGGFDARGPRNDLWSWDGVRWKPEP